MAKNILPTNYTDDIMNATMGGKRRYRQIQNSDGTISLEDATDYDRVGSDFGAGNINATNTAVNESADKNRIIDNLDAIASNTQAGYMAGALAVKEVNSNLGDMGQLELLASNTSNVDKVFSITNLTNYRYVLICYMSSDDTICTGASIVPVSLFRALTSQFMTRFNGSSSTHEKTYGATAKYISDSSIALRVIAQESGYESRLYGLK